MTNAQQPGDDTVGATDIDVGDAATLKLELFAAWAAVHPGGTQEQFEEEWLAITSDARPGPATSPPASEDQDPRVIERRMFEEWIARRPDGTRAQFEAEWAAVTAIRGV